MPLMKPRNTSTRTPSAIVAVGLRDVRTALRWSQRELSRRSGVPQSMISRIEAENVVDVSVTTASRLLDAMGARLRIEVDSPFISDRQRLLDPVHARTSDYVARRLGQVGWQAATEVEVGGDRSRGWIDVLAFHPASGLLLVVELKTGIHDLGRIERTLDWYEREAWAVARRRGWRPLAVAGCLLLLMSEENERAVAFNRESFRRLFPVRASGLRGLVDGDQPARDRGTRALAMVDPPSKRRAWIRPTKDDGRRTLAPYADYADFMRATSVPSGRSRVARHVPGAP